MNEEKPPKAKWWSRPRPDGTDPDGDFPLARPRPPETDPDFPLAGPAGVPPGGEVPSVAAEEARSEAPSGAEGVRDEGAGEGERVRPLHDPDPYSTPPYGEPGPWAPAPPVQHPTVPPPATGALPAQGTGTPLPAEVPPAPVSAPAPAPGTPPAADPWRRYDPWAVVRVRRF
ncbi:protease, partial [Streptomyces fumanus]